MKIIAYFTTGETIHAGQKKLPGHDHEQCCSRSDEREPEGWTPFIGHFIQNHSHIDVGAPVMHIAQPAEQNHNLEKFHQFRGACQRLVKQQGTHHVDGGRNGHQTGAQTGKKKQLLVDEEGTFSRNLGQTMQGLVHRHSGIWALSPVFGENRRAVRAVPHGQDGQPRRLYPVHDSIPEAGITKRAVRS